MQIPSTTLASTLAGLSRAQLSQSADSDKQLDAAVKTNAAPGGKTQGLEAIDGGKETMDRGGNGQTGYGSSEPRPSEPDPKQPAVNAPPIPAPDIDGRGAQLDLQA